MKSRLIDRLPSSQKVSHASCCMAFSCDNTITSTCRKRIHPVSGPYCMNSINIIYCAVQHSMATAIYQHVSQRAAETGASDRSSPAHSDNSPKSHPTTPSKRKVSSGSSLHSTPNKSLKGMLYLHSSYVCCNAAVQLPLFGTLCTIPMCCN